jgi:microcystin-dependent protein
MGSAGGTATVALSTQQIPAHNHTLTVSSVTGGNLTTVAGTTVGALAQPATPYTSSANTTMVAGAISNTGSGQGHENQSPYLVLNWLIALQGIFPTRS